MLRDHSGTADKPVDLDEGNGCLRSVKKLFAYGAHR
jgi:hypothetical protein